MNGAMGSILSEWNRFWFQSRSPRQVGLVRVAIGLMACIQFFRYELGATQWFGPAGWFDPAAGLFFIGDGVQGTGSQYRWSILYFAPEMAWLVALLGIIASGLMMAGIGSRIAPFISAMALAQFHQRAPFLIGVYEPLLYAILVYLIIDSGRINWSMKPGLASGPPRTSANIAIQLIRCHLGIWIVASVAGMLSHNVWWNGEAIGYLWNTGDSWKIVGNVLTHSIIALQIAILVTLVHPLLRSLGRYFFYAFVVCVLLVLGDGMYAAVLAVAGLAVWPFGISKLSN